MENHLIPIQVAAMILGAKKVKANNQSLSFTLNGKSVRYYNAHEDKMYPHWGACVMYRINNGHEQKQVNIDTEPPIFHIVEMMETETESKIQNDFVSMGIENYKNKVETTSEYDVLKAAYRPIFIHFSVQEGAMIQLLAKLNCYPSKNMVRSLSFFKKLQIKYYAYIWRRKYEKDVKFGFS